MAPFTYLLLVMLQQEKRKKDLLADWNSAALCDKNMNELVRWTNMIEVKPQKILKKETNRTYIHLHLCFQIQHRVFERNKMMLDGGTLRQLAYSLFPYLWKALATRCGEICWHWQLLQEGFILHDVQGVEDIKVLGSESLVGPWVGLLQAASVM